MAIGAKKITLPITNESTGTVSNVEYSFVQTDNTLAVSGAAADAKKTGDEISALKQDFNEYHPDLGSGYSAQLLSTVFIEDEVPYNFRTSGGSADIGDREYDEIVGVSMPINQICNSSQSSTTINGITWTNNGDGSYTANGTATADSYIPVSALTSGKANHVEFITGCPSGGGSSTYMLFDAYEPFKFDVGSGLLNKKGNTNRVIRCYVWSGATVNNVVFKPNAFDLTIMLGTQIADYVYGLEQSTAGAGVTWLRHHFPKIFDSGYIPYNAGETQSVSGLSAHRMTGFNQWDEQWELGTLNSSTGANVDANDRIRSKNFIPVIGGTQYVINKDYGLACAYDANKNYIGQMPWGYGSEVGTYYWNVPNGARYAKFVMTSTYGTTYKNDICIHLHWDGERDGQYEEYKEYEYALDDSVTLRGILKLDSSNSLYADGDRYLSDGTLDRRYGIYTFTGNEEWGQYTSWSSEHTWRTNIVQAGIPNTADTTTCLSSVYPTSTFSDVLSGNGVGIILRGDYGDLYVSDPALTSSADCQSKFKAGTTVIFLLATATTETAEPYQTPQIVDDWGTEEYVSTSLVPVGHDTKYANNLRAKLEMSPDSPEEDGDYIVRHNNGENEYVALGSTTTIQGILDRLTALENA